MEFAVTNVTVKVTLATVYGSSLCFFLQLRLHLQIPCAKI